MNGGQYLILADAIRPLGGELRLRPQELADAAKRPKPGMEVDGTDGIVVLGLRGWTASARTFDGLPGMVIGWVRRDPTGLPMTPRTALCASLLAVAAASHANVATFDGLAEGTFGPSVSDGGITFSNLDRRIPNDNPNLVVEDAHDDLAGLAGFTPSNALGFGGYVPGGGTAFGRLGSLDFSTGSLASGASLRVFAFANDPGVALTLSGFRDGALVGSSSIDLASGFSVSSQLLSLGSGTFDSFRVVASGPTNDGTAFVVLDTVDVEAVPEPATMAALGLGALGILKRRKKA